MYKQLSVGICRYVVGHMLNIFNYFCSIVRPHGLMVHCMWRRVFELHKYQSWFCWDSSVFLRIYFSVQRPQHSKPQLFMHNWKHKSNTYSYLLIHADTCIYMWIHAIYMQILTYCMYMHVLMSICRYTHVLYIIWYYMPVSVGIDRYSRYM
jgi:hypothetical protein